MFKAGVEVLSVLHDLVRQDFKDHPIDSSLDERGCFRRDFLPCWDPGWKSLMVGAIVLTASKIHYGRRMLASNRRWPARSRGSEFSHDGLTSLSDHLRSSALN
jgi:hypothetical protein